MVLISVSRVLSQDIQVVLSSVSRVLSPGHGGGLELSSVYCWVISKVMACHPLLHLPCGSQFKIMACDVGLVPVHGVSCHPDWLC